MPLPSVLNGAKQCTAKSKRTKLLCNNPAAHGCKTCRMHGARRQNTIRKGKDHPQFTYGHDTREKRAIRSVVLKELKVYAGVLMKTDPHK